MESFKWAGMRHRWFHPAFDKVQVSKNEHEEWLQSLIRTIKKRWGGHAHVSAFCRTPQRKGNIL